MNLENIINPTTTVNETSVPCVIGKLLRNLPEKYAEALKIMIYETPENGGLTNEEIALRLRSAGLAGRASSVARHKRGYCNCNINIKEL